MSALVRKWQLITAIVVMALIAGGIGATYLTGALFASGDTIEACADKQHLRIVDDSTTDCKNNEIGISWNKGDQGDTADIAGLIARIDALENFVNKNFGGGHLWSKRFGDTGFDLGFGSAVDGSGDVVVTGSFDGTVNFGGGNLTSAGSKDIFVAKFSGGL